MALTIQENADLTRVGPGTPCGTMMRRYWHPVGFTAELKAVGLPAHVVADPLSGHDLVLNQKDLVGHDCASSRLAGEVSRPQVCTTSVYTDAGRRQPDPA